MINNHVHVNVVAPAPAVMIAPMQHRHNFFVRAIWYIFVGSWLSGVTILTGSLLALSFIGMPLAFMLFNKLPQITSLRARTLNWTATTENGVTTFTQQHTKQYNIFLRALYFYPVGFVLGLAWLVLAWVIAWGIITLPISVWMYDRAPAIMTLHKH